MDAPTSTKRKRASTARSEDSDDSSKKRGRPRVDKQDESAADRRRTQIRMAQRAYRQRKESTLDELRRRVTDLTTTMACMNKTFEDCRTRLAQAGLPESQMYDLAEVSICLTNLLKSVRKSEDEDDDAAPSHLLRIKCVPSIHSEETIALPVVKNVPAWIDPISPKRPKRVHGVHTEETAVKPNVTNVPAWIDQKVLSHMTKQWQRPDIGMGYSLITPDSVPFEDLASNFNVPSLAHAMLPEAQSKSASDQLGSLPFGVAHPTNIPFELHMPKTYSFQETSLARRLHRACVESAYHLLLDPTRLPHTYERAFKLSLLGRDRQKLAASMKLVIDRGPEEDLDFWEAPLIHIGGAGTHYPRRDRNGVLQPKKHTYHLGLIGPQTLALLENAVRDKTTAEMTVEVAGFEGEWLDPYDVQGYLEEKGIHVDATSSFAEAIITELPVVSPSASTSSDSTGPETPVAQYGNQQTNYFDTKQFHELESLSVDVSRWNDVANMQVSGMPSVGYSDADTGSWTNFIDPAPTSEQTAIDNAGFFADHNAIDVAFADFSHEPTPDPKPVSRKTVVVDVAKFIKVLMATGVCLGRSPGFKRKDVDRALAISSFESF